MRLRPIFLPTIIGAAACAGAAAAEDLSSAPPHYAPPQALAQSDPLEGFNRTMFKVDRGINKLFGGRGFGGPLNILPSGLKRGVYNVFSNLDEPPSAVNQVLQGKFKQAAVTTGRFVTNTTVGLLGTRDVATGMGMQKHREDFGQTLAKYGVPSGPYIYLPLLGPSTVRDKAGNAVDGMVRPLGMVEMTTLEGQAVSGVRTAVQPQSVSIRQRARDAKNAGATDDEYAALRDLYYAKRAAEIEDAGGADAVVEPYWEDPKADVQHAKSRGARTRYAEADPRYARGRPEPRYVEFGGDYRAAPPPRAGRSRPVVSDARMVASQAAYDAYGEGPEDPAYVIGSDDDWSGEPD